MQSSENPIRVLFHHPVKDRTYDFTKCSASIPKEIESLQGLYNRFEQLDNFLLSLITLEGIDSQQLESELQFVRGITKSISKVEIHNYVLSGTRVKA